MPSHFGGIWAEYEKNPAQFRSGCSMNNIENHHLYVVYVPSVIFPTGNEMWYSLSIH